MPGLRMTGGASGADGDREPDHSLEQRLLDVAVYAPVGLVVAVAQSLPRLVADGRRTLGPGVASAQVVGRFAASAGYGMLCRRVDALRHPGAKQPEVFSTPSSCDQEERGGEGATRGVPDATVTVPRGRGGGPGGGGGEEGSGTVRPHASDARPERSGPRRSLNAPDGRDSDPGAIPAVDVLAIPGFSSLSASQVVQRLDGLTEGELRDLRAFEAGTRHRRTILNRVDQLLGR